MKTELWQKATLKQALLVFIFVFSANILFGQSDEEFYTKSLQNNKTGMYVLGSWALSNMAIGSFGWARSTGKMKYFHQMNFFWNTVNLGIAGFGLINAINTDILALTPSEMLKKHKTFENILLINTGLDIGYMGLGYYLGHRSKSKEKNKHLLAGYGNSIMLQGAFLFVFDFVLYTVQRSHRLSFSNQISWDVFLTPDQIGLVMVF
jgi:hypothetical protein